MASDAPLKEFLMKNVFVILCAAPVVLLAFAHVAAWKSMR